MKKRLCKRMLGIMAAAALLSGCAGRPKAEDMSPVEETGKLNVVTTLFPYYDFVRQIAGDQVELIMVIPAGMDSHSFEPTPADMLTIQNANVLISNGGEMEQWLAQVLDAVDTSRTTVVSMMDYVDVLEEEHVEGMEDAAHDGHVHRAAGDYAYDDAGNHVHVDEEDHVHVDEENHVHGDEEDHAHGDDDHTGSIFTNDDDGHQVEIEYDEHIWTSPVNAMKIVEIIADTLMEADPANREVYEANRDSYLEELAKLHGEFLDVVKNEKRNMIIVGDKFPFRYLADEYGLSYRAAFSGCSTDTEPSAKTIAYLIDKVKEDQIPAVYYLELSSHRVSEIISEETGAKPLLLHSCHNVTRPQFDGGITYLELQEGNVENLRKGLDQ